jgi:hypothetical protein
MKRGKRKRGSIKEKDKKRTKREREMITKRLK